MSDSVPPSKGDPFPLPTRARELSEVEPMQPSEAGEFHTPFPQANAHVVRSASGAFFIRPLVVDTNTIRNDLLRAQRQGRATALLDAGASGSVPLYCARHVPEEVDEHLPEWQPEEGLLRDAQRIWEHNYRALLRVVEIGENPPLSDDENRRVARLAAEDPDDVATAILALLINAPVLSEDRAVLRAVYGDDVDIEERAQWLRSALAGRALAEADFVVGGGVTLANALVNVTVISVSESVKALRRMPPAGVLAAVLAFGFAAARSKGSISNRLRILGQAIFRIADEVQPLIEAWQVDRAAAASHLLSATPAPVSATGNEKWHHMSQGVLARACVEILARSGAMSASQLAERLPPLPVAQGEAKVRAVLRDETYFHQLPQGRWQLGHPDRGHQRMSEDLRRS